MIIAALIRMKMVRMMLLIKNSIGDDSVTENEIDNINANTHGDNNDDCKMITIMIL